MRNFQTDFLIPALKGLNERQAARVGTALDTAIAFGVLEYLDRNPSLQDKAMVEKKYADNVERLRTL